MTFIVQYYEKLNKHIFIDRTGRVTNFVIRDNSSFFLFLFVCLFFGISRRSDDILVYHL